MTSLTSTRTRSPRTTAVIVLAVSALLIALLGSPASAASKTFTDPDDRTGFDIRTVTVTYAGRANVKVGHDGKVGARQRYKFWFDTDKTDPGPEFFLVFAPNSDLLKFRRVDGFTAPGRVVKGCRHAGGGFADIFQPRKPVRAFVSAKCLGEPQKVRVSVQLIAPGKDDWAPGFHRFYQGVRRS